MTMALKSLLSLWRHTRFNWWPYMTGDGCEFWRDAKAAILKEAQAFRDRPEMLVVRFTNCAVMGRDDTIAGKVARGKADYWQLFVEDFSFAEHYIQMEIERDNKLLTDYAAERAH